MDQKIIFELIDKFNASSMTELDFNDGGTRLILRRSVAAPGSDGTRALEQKPYHTESAPAVHLTIPADRTVKAAASSGESDGAEYVRSPIVGVFYASSGPDAPPFVKAGTIVSAGQILCVLEAMKMMNKLEAEFDCEVVAVKVSNGDMVEYGQALFEVKRLKGIR
ncbi:MAG: acetyl-CoA carboxylase biotin carboxyl carrier protein [Spirochaetaceae bacterium]|jgi:acetyl-CoA carboxylase biotin carboxyl carrier protein|nr:acetyl-CoA carboxylase biotin carboxyl carrier protein [Spirochaetaceae bacterium]